MWGEGGTLNENQNMLTVVVGCHPTLTPVCARPPFWNEQTRQSQEPKSKGAYDAVYFA